MILLRGYIISGGCQHSNATPGIFFSSLVTNSEATLVIGIDDANALSIMKKLPHQQAINGLQPFEVQPSFDRLFSQCFLPVQTFCIWHWSLEHLSGWRPANPGWNKKKPTITASMEALRFIYSKNTNSLEKVKCKMTRYRLKCDASL